MRKNLPLLQRIGLALAFLVSSFSCQHTPTESGKRPLAFPSKEPSPYTILPNNYPKLLNFNELTSLLRQHGTNTKTTKKAEQLFNSPFIDNSHFLKHGIPEPITYTKIGKALRVSTWNIEKSRNIIQVASSLKSEDHFISQLKTKVVRNNKLLKESLRQREAIALSDILLCQEMDIGHCRSKYLFAAKHLADELGMNFVFAPQQLEIDPVYIGAEDITFPNMSLSSADTCHSAKKSHYKGVFGVAVLSRYPIKRVQVFPLKSQPYDWYTGEIQKPDVLEKLRRTASEKVFAFKPTREIKVGGRGFTRVDLHVPGVPNETISVINIHLEIKTLPNKRLEQINEILDYIADIKNPVVMAGDFNNSSQDVSSTSIKRATTRSASDPQNYLTTLLHLANINVISQIRGGLNTVKNFKNPLAWHIPVVFPNKRRSLFAAIHNFRFNDGGAFDFRGDSSKSVHGHKGTLSNSNQHNLYKGFTFSFGTPRTYGPIGQDRLDWIFVKSFLTHPKDKEGSYKLAPHFGETLQMINKTATHPYSDHHPITVLLPLEDPKDN